MEDNKIIILTLTKHEVVSIQAFLMNVATTIEDAANTYDDDMKRQKDLELVATLDAIAKKIGDQRREQEEWEDAE